MKAKQGFFFWHQAHTLGVFVSKLGNVLSYLEFSNLHRQSYHVTETI